MSRLDAAAPLTAAAPAVPPRPRSVIARHPLLSFFAWFFTVGQAFAFAPLVLGAAGVDVMAWFQLFIIGSTLVGLLLPALVITRIVDGRAGVIRLLRSAVRVRAGVLPYVLVLLALPAVALAISALVSGWPAGVGPLELALGYLGVFALQLLLAFVPNNWAEEVAWTGFVQGRLRRTHSLLVAALIAAPLFAAQHVVGFVTQGPVMAVILFAVMTVLVIPFRLLAGWLSETTGSLLVVGLFHAAGNAVAGGSGFGEGWAAQLWGAGPLVGIVHFLSYAAIGILVLVVLAIRRRRASAGAATASS